MHQSINNRLKRTVLNHGTLVQGVLLFLFLFLGFCCATMVSSCENGAPNADLPNDEQTAEPVLPPYEKMPWPEPLQSEFSYGEGECASTLLICFEPHNIPYERPKFPADATPDFIFTFNYTAQELETKKYKGIDLFQLAYQSSPKIQYEGKEYRLFEYSLGSVSAGYGAPIQSIRFREKYYGGFTKKGYWSYWVNGVKNKEKFFYSQEGFSSQPLFPGSKDYWIVSQSS